jgi:outer membrane lipoprotein carrier protein
MRNFLFTISARICVVAAVQAQPLSPGDVNNLLARIRDKRAAAPYVQADFQEEKIIRLMKKPIVSTGKVWFEAPNKFRREVKGNSPSLMVSDGQQLWIYYPTFRSAEHYSLGQHSPLDKGLAAITAALNLENVQSSYQITGSKNDKGYELELIPRRASVKKLFAKFDLRLNENLLVDRTEMLSTNGERIVTVYSNQARAPIPESTFEFTPPSGTEITAPLGR